MNKLLSRIPKIPPHNAPTKHIPMDWPELHRAAYLGNVIRVESLAKDPIELTARDRWGRGALHVAVANNNLAAANILLSSGAHVDAQDVLGISPLHVAVKEKNIPMMKLLINYHADPEIRDDKGQSPVTMARGQASLLEILEVSYGYLDKKDSFGQAPGKKSQRLFGFSAG